LNFFVSLKALKGNKEIRNKKLKIRNKEAASTFRNPQPFERIEPFEQPSQTPESFLCYELK